MDWRCGWRGRAPALQHKDLSSNPSSTPSPRKFILSHSLFIRTISTFQIQQKFCFFTCSKVELRAHTCKAGTLWIESCL
jgi:hypothetical protein